MAILVDSAHTSTPCNICTRAVMSGNRASGTGETSLPVCAACTKRLAELHKAYPHFSDDQAREACRSEYTEVVRKQRELLNSRGPSQKPGPWRGIAGDH